MKSPDASLQTANYPMWQLVLVLPDVMGQADFPIKHNRLSERQEDTFENPLLSSHPQAFPLSPFTLSFQLLSFLTRTSPFFLSSKVTNMMRRIFASVVFLIVLLSSRPLHQVAGVGNGPQKDAYPPIDPTGPMVHLENGYEGKFGTRVYTKKLNSVFKGWEMDPSPLAEASVQERKEVEARLNMVHDHLLGQRTAKGLLYLGMTPDNKRKVHAMFLYHLPEGSPNVAFVSSPKPWKSLEQRMQLHNFAIVNKQDKTKFHRSLSRDFSASELDAHIRNIVPKTPENGLSRILPTYVHPDYYHAGPPSMQKIKDVLEEPVDVNKARLLA